MGLHTFCMEPPIHAWCAQYSYEHTVHDTVQLYRYQYGILWAAEFVLWASSQPGKFVLWHIPQCILDHNDVMFVPTTS